MEESATSTTPAIEGDGDHQILVRMLRPEDAAEIASISKTVYKKIDAAWNETQFRRLIEIFPDGQVGVEDNGKIVAFACSLIVNYERYGDKHTYMQITGDFKFTTHDPDGDVLYGIEVCVDPSYQGLRLGRRLYDARKELCENLNLRAIVAGGRMPNYNKYQEQMTPRAYIDLVSRKEVYDPVLSFQLSNGFHVKKVLTDYLTYDTESKAFATLLQWDNIYYERKPKLVGLKRTTVRLGLVQAQMRSTRDMAAFFDNTEFFIDAVSGYKADFCIFPEYLNAPLMAPYNDMGPAASIRKLAEMTDEIREFFTRKAVEYNINIVTGTMPLYQDNHLYNVGYLCRRDGTWDGQYKIHITPSEEDDWGMVGGDELKVFETDCGKVAILICYDVEFPELGRMLADRGVQILFVPFCTDTSTGYYRVRHCAQARAIENECYVAIAGSVGNLPKVVNMDIQYAQSCVLSPSDFAFPNGAVVSEATANTEMTLIVDVDLDDLKDLHSHGSVRNLQQRRQDLYTLKWNK
ncbi:MAG: bifunctional GNAT family N-acetyltransferase/carbon-nitrogen hydrolase family protein [Verrucomicrobiales bacterium]|nr:bifunctional GNAT family N-acetyltransferase/carbon-nitrogen hydrolase family protein [Verrucomicrobiae bacterium]